MTDHGSWQGSHDKQKSMKKKQPYDSPHAAAAAALYDGLASRTSEQLLTPLQRCPLPPSRSPRSPATPAIHIGLGVSNKFTNTSPWFNYDVRAFQRFL